jgi:hypothetical protein
VSAGLELSREYAAEVVGPTLDRTLPGVPVALARLGSGSDMLGFDDATSRDHDWGLRLTVLVAAEHVDAVDAALERELPGSWRGHPVRFATTWQPVVRQRAEVVEPVDFARSRTGLDLSREPDAAEWLSLTGQAALEVTAGAVFRDDAGVVTRMRERLAEYPDDIRRHAIAAGWTRIGQELPLVGRTADRGDAVGSRIVAARLARTAMHLGFLLERRWAPYAKWLGTAFAALPGAGGLVAALDASLAAEDWRSREAGLVAVIDALARRQGELGLPTLEPATGPFWSRPYAALRELPELVQASIADPALRALPLVGTPEQWSDSVDLLVDGPRRLRMTRALLAGESGATA